MLIPLITVKKISKSFNKRHILSNVNLEIYEKEIFGIIGTSGSGKSTLLETMIGFIYPDSGDITVQLDSFYTNTTSRKKKNHNQKISVFSKTEIIDTFFGYAAQEPSFYGNLTVEQNLIYFGELYDIPKVTLKHKIDELLKTLEIKGERFNQAKNLSLGTQKRLDLACALIHDPKVLILDEPTADLDIITSSHLWKTIKKINSLGTTIILSTHSLNEIENICNRVAFIDKNTVKLVGKPKDITKKFLGHHKIKILTEELNYRSIVDSIKREGLKISKATKKGNDLILYTKHPSKVMMKLLKIIENQDQNIINITIEEPTLDSVFEFIINKT